MLGEYFMNNWEQTPDRPMPLTQQEWSQGSFNDRSLRGASASDYQNWANQFWQGGTDERTQLLESHGLGNWSAEPDIAALPNPPRESLGPIGSYEMYPDTRRQREMGGNGFYGGTFNMPGFGPGASPMSDWGSQLALSLGGLSNSMAAYQMDAQARANNALGFAPGIGGPQWVGGFANPAQNENNFGGGYAGAVEGRGPSGRY